MRPFTSLRKLERVFALSLGLLALNSLPVHAQSTNAGVSPEEVNGSQAYKKLSLEELMNLDVTSVARQPQPWGEAPAAINLITSDEIHRSGATSFPEALRLADNLDVAQVSSSSWDISARGFNSSVSDKLLVLVDGRSVYSPILQGTLWPFQNYLLEDIDRIEVISGPGGTLWGANAVNGVINITSKSSRDTQGLYFQGGGGNELQDFVGGRYGATLESNVYFRVYGTYFDRVSEVYADGTSANDAWNQGQIGFRLDDYRLDQNQFTLQGDLFDGNTDTQPGGEGFPRAEGTSGGGNILGRWTHTFSDDRDMSLQLYYDRTDLAAPFQSNAPIAAVPIPSGVLSDELDTYNADFQDRFPLGDWNRVVWGLGYQFTHNVVHDAPLVGFEPNILDQNLFSGFLQDEIKIADPLHLTLGSKLEHNDFTGWEYEPSGRLQYNVSDKQMLWFAISRAVRTPSLFDRDLFEPAPGYGTLLGTSNSSFESETVIAYELGWRAQFSPKVTGSLSAFYNDYTHLRSLNLTGGTMLPAIYQNDLQGRTYGFEASADYQVYDWWRMHAGYDLLKEEIDLEPGGADLESPFNEVSDPQQQVFVRSSMDLPCRLTLDAAFRWIDTVHNANGAVVGVVPAYAEADARLGWHATKTLELALVGQNLVHNQHPEAGFPGLAQEQIARSVYVEASYRW